MTSPLPHSLLLSMPFPFYERLLTQSISRSTLATVRREAERLGLDGCRLGKRRRSSRRSAPILPKSSSLITLCCLFVSCLCCSYILLTQLHSRTIPNRGFGTGLALGESQERMSLPMNSFRSSLLFGPLQRNQLTTHNLYIKSFQQHWRDTHPQAPLLDGEMISETLEAFRCHILLSSLNLLTVTQSTSPLGRGVSRPSTLTDQGHTQFIDELNQKLADFSTPSSIPVSSPVAYESNLSLRLSLKGKGKAWHRRGVRP